jgi:uncharacterized protein (DUF1330 family)
MSVYFIANSTIDDQALLDEYVQAAGATLGLVELTLLAADLETDHVEGKAAGNRTVILEFGSEADFRTWYDSPEYQAIVDKRLSATTGFGILVHGV